MNPTMNECKSFLLQIKKIFSTIKKNYFNIFHKIIFISSDWKNPHPRQIPSCLLKLSATWTRKRIPLQQIHHHPKVIFWFWKKKKIGKRRIISSNLHFIWTNFNIFLQKKWTRQAIGTFWAPSQNLVPKQVNILIDFTYFNIIIS